MTKPLSSLDFSKKLCADIKKHWKLFAIILPFAFLLSIAYILGLADMYTTTIKLAPENADRVGSYKLIGLANSFGLKMEKDMNGEAIYPRIYPEITKSNTFKIDLLKTLINYKGKSLTYYDYLVNYQKVPWWRSLLFKNEYVKPEKIDPFSLTYFQSVLMKVVGGRIKCEYDNITSLISITVRDQDPMIAAVMADSVSSNLKKYIIDYHCNKARINYVYFKKMQMQAKARYEKASTAYADFLDANQGVFLEQTKSKLNELEIDLNLKFNMYSDAYSKMTEAHAKMQEAKPAFMTLQSPTVSLEKSEPNSNIIFLIVFFVVSSFLCLYIFYKEGDLKRVLLGERALGISKCPRIKI